MDRKNDDNDNNHVLIDRGKSKHFMEKWKIYKVTRTCTDYRHCDGNGLNSLNMEREMERDAIWNG